MALTETQKLLVQSVALGNWKDARKFASACIGEDASKKNENWGVHWRNVLNDAGAAYMELPYEVQKILLVEDVSKTLGENRYHLAEPERELCEYIMRMKAVSEKMAGMSIHYINATLLYGKSGTGKTMFGRYVAYRAGLPFCYINFANTVDGLVGKTAKNISMAFSWATQNPCVFMLDEVDTVSCTRAKTGNDAAGNELSRVTVTLMQEFDRLPNDVIVIGATNRPDRIDPALMRRFTVKHEVKQLDYDGYAALIDRFLADVGMELKEETKEKIAATGTSQADTVNMLVREIAEKLMAESEEAEEAKTGD